MSSPALHHWQQNRSARLQQLEAAHEEMGGRGPGRRWRTEQVNWSLFLRLAGEFQGFARELHQLGAEEFAHLAAGGNRPLQGAIEHLLTRERQLDSRNANSGTLGADFGRFGVRWWPALVALDSRTKRRMEVLDLLNRARNAIAHDEPGEINELRANNDYPLTLRVFRLTRSALDALAVSMDAELARHLGSLFGRVEPW